MGDVILEIISAPEFLLLQPLPALSQPWNIHNPFPNCTHCLPVCFGRTLGTVGTQAIHAGSPGIYDGEGKKKSIKKNFSLKTFCCSYSYFIVSSKLVGIKRELFKGRFFYDHFILTDLFFQQQEAGASQGFMSLGAGCYLYEVSHPMQLTGQYPK